MHQLTGFFVERKQNCETSEKLWLSQVTSRKYCPPFEAHYCPIHLKSPFLPSLAYFPSIFSEAFQTAGCCRSLHGTVTLREQIMNGLEVGCARQVSSHSLSQRTPENAGTLSLTSKDNLMPEISTFKWNFDFLVKSLLLASRHLYGNSPREKNWAY